MWWLSTGKMWSFPGKAAYKNRTHWGPRCPLPLITSHLRQVLCYIFNEMKRRATAFISHLTFESSVRADKLQFGERSSEILTRASSKPPQSITVWYIHKSMALGWQRRSALQREVWHIGIWADYDFPLLLVSRAQFGWYWPVLTNSR